MNYPFNSRCRWGSKDNLKSVQTHRDSGRELFLGMIGCVEQIYLFKLTYLHITFLGELSFKEIVHFEMNFCYVLAYLKGIRDVGVFVSAVFSILIFLGQTICQSYNGGLWGPPQSACTEKPKLNMI